MSTFDPSTLMSILQKQGSNLMPSPNVSADGSFTASPDLSGTNKFNTFPSSNNSTPDAPQPSAPSPQAPQPPPPTPSAPQAPQQDQRLSGVKGYLANILHGVGEGMKAHLGMETDAQQQQRLYTQGLQTQKANIDQQNIKSEIAQRAATVKQMQSAVTLPNGMQVPFALAKPYIDAWGKQQAAATGKRYMIVPNVGMLDTQPEGGGGPQLVPGSSPQGVQINPDIAHQYNIPLELVGKTLPLGQFAQMERGGAAWAGNVSNTTETKELGDGTLVQIPKTTTSQKVAPNSSVVPTGTPQGPGQQPVQTSAPKSKPPVSLNTRGGVKTLVGPDGQPLQGKTAADVGPAYDPKTNQYLITTRSDASQSGYQNFMKSSPAQVENDRQLNNRVTDVTQKTGRYEQSFNQDLSAGDKYVISKLMSDQHFEAAFKPFGVGVTIPTGFITELDKAAQANGLSPQGIERLHAYFNQREAMSGYQRVLTGSSRGGEKNLQLQLDVIPSPLSSKDVAANGFNQFKENLRIASQGIPRMKGVQTPGDIENRFSQPNNAPPAGAKIRDYTQFK